MKAGGRRTSIGNLLLAALTQTTGDYQAIEQLGSMIGSRGACYVNDSDVRLRAEIESGDGEWRDADCPESVSHQAAR